MSRSSGGAALKVTDAVPVFTALADATRLGLLGRLSVEGPLSITRLSEGTGVTRQAITRHLYALGGAGRGGPPRPGGATGGGRPPAATDGRWEDVRSIHPPREAA